MTPADHCPPMGDLSLAAAARRCAQLKARAERWSRLCRELSLHAAELKNLRDELAPGASGAGAREARLAAWQRQLERREAELEQRWKALERCVRELVRRRKELEAWQRRLEQQQSHSAPAEVQVARALELERRAAERYAEVERLSRDLDACETELRELAAQLDEPDRPLDTERQLQPDSAAPPGACPAEGPASGGA